MTTEGLTGRLSDMQIQKISLKSTNVKKLCSQLIYEARRINRDRIMTVGLIRLDRKVPVRKNLIMAYGGLLFVCIAVIAFYFREHSWKIAPDEPVAMTQTAPEEEAAKPKVDPPTEKEETSPPPAFQEPLRTPEEPSSFHPNEKVTLKQTHEKEIHEFVAAWEQAWEKTAGPKGDIETYMNFYSEKFSSGGFNKTAWKRDKAKKSQEKRWIQLEMRDVRILGALEGSRVEVRFRQIYKSSNFSVNSRKKLVLGRENSTWKILSEKTY